ncbi:MAG: hypothetical protein ABR536_04175 [Solirubrobacterales bacterium]
MSRADSVYALIGRAVIGFIRYRYGRQIRIAGTVAAISAVALGAAYVATRDANEA